MSSGMTDRSQLVFTRNKRPLSSARWGAAAATFGVALMVYWLTAYRTITWWSSSQLALAASDLGVMAPPGAVIPTFLGWIVMHVVPEVSGIFALNLFAGLLAALTAVGVLLLGYRLEWLGTVAGRSHFWGVARNLIWVAGGASALAFAFGAPIWEYARHYSEYIVTPLFTVLILWGMIRWWEAARMTGGYGWLFVTTLLFGLDVSVHRTNALLLPALVVWVLLGYPRAVLSLKTWLAGIGGFVLGLAFHLVLIPMAAADPFLNVWEPDTVGRWWEYVSLQMFGGGFLVNLYPRNADLWHVQVMDWVTAFTRIFARTDGPLGVLGVMPLLIGLWGVIVLFRRSARLGVGLVVLFLAASAGAIVYFNIPENFFRTLYRHYFPSLVIFGAIAVVGAAALVRGGSQLAGWWGRLVPVVVTILVLLAPVNSLLGNYSRLDASDDYFAHDYAVNLLSPLAPDAILLTRGDNDTFPLWYLQRVEGIRPDVQVLNLPLLNTGWFVEQRMRHDPGLPLGDTESDWANHGPIPWATDTVVAIPVAAEAPGFDLPVSIAVPDTVWFRVPPTAGGAYLLGQDQVVLRLIENSGWRRPMYVVGGLGQGALPWLVPYVRMEGLVQRIVPVPDPPLDTAMLARNLFERFSYRAFENPADSVEMATLGYMQSLAVSHATLGAAYFGAGDTTATQRVCAQMFERLRFDKWLSEAPFVTEMRKRCEGNEPDTGKSNAGE